MAHFRLKAKESRSRQCGQTANRPKSFDELVFKLTELKNTHIIIYFI